METEVYKSLVVSFERRSFNKYFAFPVKKKRWICKEVHNGCWSLSFGVILTLAVNK